MRSRSRRALLAAFLTAAMLVPLGAARAQPWQNIVPGQSTEKDVVGRFGQPAKRLQEKGRTVFSYQEDHAIKGARQANFYFDKKGVVVEIHVFPKAVVAVDVVVSTFGTGFTKRLTDDYRTYYYYGKLGLVVFLSTNGKTVSAFLYTVPGAQKG